MIRLPPKPLKDPLLLRVDVVDVDRVLNVYGVGRDDGGRRSHCGGCGLGRGSGTTAAGCGAGKVWGGKGD